MVRIHPRSPFFFIVTRAGQVSFGFAQDFGSAEGWHSSDVVVLSPLRTKEPKSEFWGAIGVLRRYAPQDDGRGCAGVWVPLRSRRETPQVESIRAHHFFVVCSHP